MGINHFLLARLNDGKKNLFLTVHMFGSKNDFSGGEIPPKINLGNNCHPNVQCGDVYFELSASSKTKNSQASLRFA